MGSPFGCASAWNGVGNIELIAKLQFWFLDKFSTKLNFSGLLMDAIDQATFDASNENDVRLHKAIIVTPNLKQQEQSGSSPSD